MNRQDDKSIELATKHAFSEMRQLPDLSDPQMAAKVLARLSRESAPHTTPSFWKAWAFGSSAVSLALLGALVFSLTRAPKFEAYLGRPFVVKMQVDDLKRLAVTHAEIRLPDGVEFDLADYPELSSRRSLRVVWRSQEETDFVPIVLKSADLGMKRVVVEFFDERGSLVGTRDVEIRVLPQKGRGPNENG